MEHTTTNSQIPTILLQEQSIEQHTNGNITGIVFWNWNGHNFPDNAWNDFVIVVLGWWTQAVARLLSGTTTTETMDFMDGPYSIVCNTMKDSIDCQFIDRYNDIRVVESWKGTTHELAKVIFSASKIALRFCHLHELASTDIEILEKEVCKLRDLIYQESKRGRS